MCDPGSLGRTVGPPFGGSDPEKPQRIALESVLRLSRSYLLER